MNEKFQSARYLLINLFIVIYVSICVLWLCPNAQIKAFAISPIRPAVHFFGLWQGYNVFAPNPRRKNFYLEAKIKFDDGSESIWCYPRMEKLSLVQRVMKERYRKYGDYLLEGTRHDFLWIDLARFVARQTDSQDKHPLFITFVRHSRKIPPPRIGIKRALPQDYKSYEFFFYRVLPEDLK